MDKKRIKITTNGPITIPNPKKGVPTYIWGPVLTPYYETVDMIFKLLSVGVKINEVTDGGDEVELTLQNYQNDNSKKTKAKETTKAAKAEEDKKKKEAEAKAKAEQEAIEKAEKEAEELRIKSVEEATEVDETVDVETVDQTKTTQNNKSYSKNNNRNYRK